MSFIVEQLTIKAYDLKIQIVVSVILNELLKQSLIELLIPKRLEEVDMVDHPKYSKYHRIINHSIEKFFVHKDMIDRMKNEGRV
ncbi:hypothetical protein SADUNF_Sadunf04G0094500 [Salix dunnii]|uniref:Uncharacterized protein n=1 Tax=Salix dunnii TaxID=1413687 RepID=A0A835K916_9ROSI|nr:hypothetical protein SADUNF_Sadunf04G0094500 [Salix dunnii]